MPKKTRRMFLTAALPATVLATPVASRQAPAPARPSRKIVHRRPGRRQDRLPLFNEAVSYGDLLFIAGKGAGSDFEEEGIRAHTKSALDKLEAALTNAGSSMKDVLKVTVYLANSSDYQGMNEAYRDRFGPEPPVRSTITGVGIPDGSLVEIECVAHL